MTQNTSKHLHAHSRMYSGFVHTRQLCSFVPVQLKTCSKPCSHQSCSIIYRMSTQGLLRYVSYSVSYFLLFFGCHFAVVVAAVVFFVLHLSPRLCTDDGTLKSKNFLLRSVPFEQKVLHFQGLTSLKRLKVLRKFRVKAVQEAMGGEGTRDKTE